MPLNKETNQSIYANNDYYIPTNKNFKSDLKKKTTNDCNRTLKIYL